MSMTMFLPIQQVYAKMVMREHLIQKTFQMIGLKEPIFMGGFIQF